MSSFSLGFPRWLVVLTAQVLVGIAILNVYLIRRRAMDQDTVSVVSFERIPNTDYQESEVHIVAPGKAEVNIHSSAGSGGYAMMVVDVVKNENGRPTKATIPKIPKLSGQELQAFIERSVEKVGVMAERPVIKNPVSRPGASQVYSGAIEVKNPGEYSVVYAQARPWEPDAHQIYYVVHVRAD